MSHKIVCEFKRIMTTERNIKLIENEAQPMLRSPRWVVITAKVLNNYKVFVRVEAPGLETKEFDIQVIDDALIIKGKKGYNKPWLMMNMFMSVLSG